MNIEILIDKVGTYGVKKCSKCGIEFPNIKEYFYQTTGTKDGLRTDCKRCQDTQKLRKKISYLKELETVEAAKAKEAEIRELKRIIEKGNQERKNLENIIAMTDERNESLSDTAAKFSEKYLRSHKWNYVLGVCLVLIIIGSGLIIFL